MIIHGDRGKRIMATFQVNPPEQFTFKPEEWGKWSRRFERFRIASGLSKESEDSQINALIYSMGDGVVLKETETPRQYIVQTPSAVIHRNHRHLAPLSPQTPIHSSEASSSPTPLTTVNREIFASPKLPEMNITSRPKRLLKPSLKALESMSNS